MVWMRPWCVWPVENIPHSNIPTSTSTSDLDFAGSFALIIICGGMWCVCVLFSLAPAELYSYPGQLQENKRAQQPALASSQSPVRSVLYDCTEALSSFQGMHSLVPLNMMACGMPSTTLMDAQKSVHYVWHSSVSNTHKCTCSYISPLTWSTPLKR